MRLLEDQITVSDWRANDGMVTGYAGLMARGSAPRLVRDGRERTGLRTGKFKLQGEWGTNMNGAPAAGRGVG